MTRTITVILTLFSFAFTFCDVNPADDGLMSKNVRDSIDLLINQYYSQGNYVECEKLNDKIIPPHNYDFNYYYNRTRIKYNLNKLAEALIACNRAIAIRGDKPDLYFIKSSIFLDLHYNDSSVLFINKALVYDSLNVGYHFVRAKLYASLDIPSFAIESINKCLSLLPKDPTLRQWRANYRFEQGDTLGAISDSDTILIYAPNSAEIYADRGRYQFARKKYKEALKDLDISINLKPIYGNVFLLRGSIKSELNEKDGMCDDLLKAAELGCQEAMPHLYKCDKYFQKKGIKINVRADSTRLVTPKTNATTEI